jgi:hypothetical protein
VIETRDDSAETQTLVTAIADAAEAAVQQRISVWAGIAESNKLWDAMSYPYGSGEAEQQLMAVIEKSQLLRPLLDHGAADGALLVGHYGTNVNAHSIASGLIADSLRESLIMEGNIHRDGLEAAAKQNLNRWIAAAQERNYTTWIVMGLDVNMQAGMRLQLPWGLFASSVIQSPGIVILAGPLLAVPVSVRAWLKPVKNDQRYAAAEALADRALLVLSAAIALAFDDVMPPVQKWRAILGPGLSGMSLWSTPSYSQHGDGLLPEMTPELEAWTTQLEILHDSRLDIALERLARARAERNSWEDQLIDAVIAWENVCGGKTETTFRVTGSLAKLIEREPGTDRQKLQDSLVNVYGVRSGLVHGGAVERHEIISAAGTAMAIARSALRALYLDRNHLIPMTANQRAAQLLMHEP